MSTLLINTLSTPHASHVHLHHLLIGIPEQAFYLIYIKTRLPQIIRGVLRINHNNRISIIVHTCRHRSRVLLLVMTPLFNPNPIEEPGIGAHARLDVVELVRQVIQHAQHKLAQHALLRRIYTSSPSAVRTTPIHRGFLILFGRLIHVEVSIHHHGPVVRHHHDYRRHGIHAAFIRRVQLVHILHITAGLIQYE